MEVAFAASFKLAALYLSAVVEAIAGLIIAFAVAEATWRVFKMAAWRESSHGAKEAIRLHLGRWLALVLEFLLAADILRTAVAPTWNEIGQLAAIVVLRTVLNYFLQIEIDKAAKSQISPASGVLPAQGEAVESSSKI